MVLYLNVEIREWFLMLGGIKGFICELDTPGRIEIGSFIFCILFPSWEKHVI